MHVSTDDVQVYGVVVRGETVALNSSELGEAVWNIEAGCVKQVITRGVCTLL